MMKKAIAIFMACLLLSGCGGKKSENIIDKSAIPAETIHTTSSPKPKIYEEKNMLDKTLQWDIQHFILMILNNENFVVDKNLGRFIPCAPDIGIAKKNGQRKYINLDYLNGQAPKGDEKFLVYKDEKLIGKAKFINLPPDEDGEQLYGLQFENQSIQLDLGYYIVINGEWDAVPKSYRVLDKNGSLEADLNGSGKLDKIQVKIDLDEHGHRAKNLYYNGEVLDYFTPIEDESTFPEGWVPRNSPLDILIKEGFFGLYDLDGDGNMELLVSVAWGGDDSLDIFSFSDGKFEEVYAWYSGGETRYIDETGEVYYYPHNDGERVYYDNEYEQLEPTDSSNPQHTEASGIVKSSPTPVSQSNISVLPYDKAIALIRSHDGTRPFEMLGQNEKTEKDFWHRLYYSFQIYNSKYKETPEEIISGLKDLSWHPNQNFALFIWNADQLLQEEPEKKEKLLSVLENEVIPYWKEKPGYSFNVYLVENK